MINQKNKKLHLYIGIGILAILIVIILIIVFSGRNRKDLLLTYTVSGMTREVRNGTILTLESGDEHSINILNDDLTLNTIWESSNENIATAEVKGGRAIISSSGEGTVSFKVSAKGYKDITFSIQFVVTPFEFDIVNTAWESGGVRYYFLPDGSFYSIYENAEDYTKGSYSYKVADNVDISTALRYEMLSYVPGGVVYRMDILVDAEYLEGNIYNRNEYILYICGNGNEYVLHDNGWDFTKETSNIEMLDRENLEDYIYLAEVVNNENLASLELGDLAYSAWSCDGVNYYFYGDGTFEIISIVNHDFIKGTYSVEKIKADDIEENIKEAIAELIKADTFYNIKCTIEKEIYNNENVSVTSINLIMAKRRSGIVIYDDSWNLVCEAKKVTLQSKDDFEILFTRSKPDVTGLFVKSAWKCNGIEYNFYEDGTFYLEDEGNDIYGKGTYLITDIPSDLFPKKLSELMECKDYYYVELGITKMEHSKSDKPIEWPESSYLIIGNDDSQILIYDDYYGTIDDARKITIE